MSIYSNIEPLLIVRDDDDDDDDDIKEIDSSDINYNYRWMLNEKNAIFVFRQ